MYPGLCIHRLVERRGGWQRQFNERLNEASDDDAFTIPGPRRWALLLDRWWTDREREITESRQRKGNSTLNTVHKNRVRERFNRAAAKQAMSEKVKIKLQFKRVDCAIDHRSRSLTPESSSYLSYRWCRKESPPQCEQRELGAIIDYQPPSGSGLGMEV